MGNLEVTAGDCSNEEELGKNVQLIEVIIGVEASYLVRLGRAEVSPGHKVSQPVHQFPSDNIQHFTLSA
jgi:hypothetical protein